MLRIVTYSLLFVVTVLLQVFLFDNLSVSIYLNPLIYVAFIVLLPVDTFAVWLLFAGVVMGATMDFLMGTAGINTIATVLIAFVRPFLLTNLYGRDDLRDGGQFGGFDDQRAGLLRVEQVFPGDRRFVDLAVVGLALARGVVGVELLGPESVERRHLVVLESGYVGAAVELEDHAQRFALEDRRA